ncbi:hypothetical protein AXG93_1617s1320 [Marchantia polymorpha subsp. ruderalis]|uniref:Uncharacterized protein n=1 Tax=Marchantia polymorpha subsp. ruderalis TaxID=1480154 RepID=A0A176W6R3_MARPO|nr:hypothetical protein AXG93_1617s1320 [Marchantia polymorpha subsp. ruderalis]
MDVDGVRQPRARARLKKRANRRMMTAEVSDSSVEKTVAPIVNTSEVAASEFARGEETPQLKMNEDLEKKSTLREENLEQVVAQIGGTVVEAKGITLPTSPVKEVRPEEGKKVSNEDVKTLEVTFPEFLHDSVVPLLKSLDGKRGKYAVSKEPGFYVQMIRNRRSPTSREGNRAMCRVRRDLWRTSYL